MVLMSSSIDSSGSGDKREIPITSILTSPHELKLWYGIKARLEYLNSHHPGEPGPGKVVLLTHHYQRPEIVLLGSQSGDSFELSRYAANSGAEKIVFCGVRFMAESAAILAGPGQKVYHPEPEAGCPMADMVDLPSIEAAYRQVSREMAGQVLMPVVYMNSPAEVKAFCGNAGGIICTSSNAASAIRWGLERGEKILFAPDEHLGRNSFYDMGFREDELLVWDPAAHSPLGGNSPAALRRAKAILWKGYCHVHTWFTAEHVLTVRAQYPGVKVYVHPECRHEVVQAADGAGSTGYLVKMVESSTPGSVIAIGTETSLVRRLALQYPDRKVIELSRSLCPNMFRITLKSLLNTLEEFPAEKEVTVSEEVRTGARLALERMLTLQP